MSNSKIQKTRGKKIHWKGSNIQYTKYIMRLAKVKRRKQTNECHAHCYEIPLHSYNNKKRNKVVDLQSDLYVQA